MRYLEVRQGDRAVVIAPLLITAKPGGLLFYDPPRLAGMASVIPNLATPLPISANPRVDIGCELARLIQPDLNTAGLPVPR